MIFKRIRKFCMAICLLIMIGTFLLCGLIDKDNRVIVIDPMKEFIHLEKILDDIPKTCDACKKEGHVNIYRGFDLCDDCSDEADAALLKILSKKEKEME